MAARDGLVPRSSDQDELEAAAAASPRQPGPAPAKSLNTSTGSARANAMAGSGGPQPTGGSGQAAPQKTTPWYGHNRAVGREELTPTERQAFNPMGDPRIADAYNPFGNARFESTYNSARDLQRDATGNRSALEHMLGQTFQAPTYAAPNAYETERINAAMPGAFDDQAMRGLTRSENYMGHLQDSRRDQDLLYRDVQDWAQGNMPSVGRDIANEAGAVANEQFFRAGSEANQAYGSAAGNAAQAYQDALAQQLFSTQQAGQNAAQQTQDSAADAVLRQAALTSMARGGNIGMALRQGLQGAATQSQAANVQGARLMDAANQQAAFLAGQGQRAAQNAELQSNLAMQGTQERAGNAAAAAELQARLRGAQIGSQEQQNMMGLSADIAGQMRSGDLGEVGAAVDVGNLGLGINTLQTNAAQADANRLLNADQFNSSQAQQNAQYYDNLGLDYNRLNSANILNTNQLNSQNWNQSAGRFQGDQQFGISTQAGMTQFDAQAEQALAAAQMGSEQALVQLLTQMDENSRTRLLQEYAFRTGALNASEANRLNARNQNISLGVQAAGAAGTLTAAGLALNKMYGGDSSAAAAPAGGAPTTASPTYGGDPYGNAGGGFQGPY